ncbi:protein-methionine-sulfoxide reductase catalytic subunit MsrP [Pseudoroseomonas cervicalis]|uniref:Oxidoreductase molybdopterin binding domain protein n=1 Tax=Pseudoroseomonas cervicalis ATCC 49957 TaxID=525371 RepID=D5RPX4_9PROT|nr:protein-methionine-sulfoxide reductase catalytic subunit MsrP [Pseudoroseomonas cervicalis]EFH10621.1 oxidoreductase molybdopterin binding domain protein [Pseudoroseomonas cervicalis ATCC 49957]
MPIRIPRGWELPESAATPEHLVLGRRKAMGLGAGLIAGGLAAPALAQQAGMAAMRNTRYPPERALTPERDATSYNNYYEFGSSKNVSGAAQRLRQSPWTLRLEGMVEKPQEIGLEDLLKRVSLEERVLRHRCVEAWAMTVPWTGFAMSDLLKIATPLSSAKYVVFETVREPSVMPGLRQSWYPWPYTEGCTIEEAANELCFLAVGLYGKPVPAQNGGPIRVLFPWKYGFKSGKSLAAIRFTDTRPVSFWEKLQPSEYGFWANVNPEVPHPRWSQASERLLGSNERVPTKLFNGYGAFVADLYQGLQSERLYL